MLIIAGSDSGGGAGIQADIKSVTCLGGYAATAITALTAQNTRGVFGIHPIPTDFIRQQIALVLSDIGADSIKTGMLASAAIIEAVADELEAQAPSVPLVVDPVMVAKGGATLLQDEAIASLRSRLLPRAALLTPNLPEAGVLTGRTIVDLEGMERAGSELLAMGARAVLVKGGHMDGEIVTDLLVWSGGSARFSGPRIATTSTHGTGCTLASAIATGLAQGLSVPDAAHMAHTYVQAAMAAAPGLGGGHGPLGHAAAARALK